VFFFFSLLLLIVKLLFFSYLLILLLCLICCVTTSCWWIKIIIRGLYVIRSRSVCALNMACRMPNVKSKVVQWKAVKISWISVSFLVHFTVYFLPRSRTKHFPRRRNSVGDVGLIFRRKFKWKIPRKLHASKTSRNFISLNFVGLRVFVSDVEAKETDEQLYGVMDRPTSSLLRRCRIKSTSIWDATQSRTWRCGTSRLSSAASHRPYLLSHHVLSLPFFLVQAVQLVAAVRCNVV